METVNNAIKKVIRAANRWTKIPITDSAIKKLIQQVMAPKEFLHNLQSQNFDQLSTCIENVCDNVYEYGISNPTQQMNTTKGTMLGAYNSITGYFQNVCSYKNEEAKLKSIMYGTVLQRTQKAFGLCENFGFRQKQFV